MSWLRMYHTLRYLKPVQIYGRLLRHLPRSGTKVRPVPSTRQPVASWTQPGKYHPTMSGSDRFFLLNEEHEVKTSQDWSNVKRDRLWLYNLHYFDDLNADGAAERLKWHEVYMTRWIKENPTGNGPGWEPYPISRRIVNWIKWQLAGNSLKNEALQSLAQQARYLTRRVEWHLLGNHILANAKALLFAGIFFQGKEADAWLRQGLAILHDEVQEQVLADGGHFELSPMYHAIVLEDLLDILNLLRSYGYEECFEWDEDLSAMLRWLETMCHPDGEIVLFNDAAFGMALPPQALFEYAERLEVEKDTISLPEMTCLEDSGYIRLQHGGANAFLDLAPLGPDYLPAHGHADTFTFELSVRGQRMLVDSGTSCYGQSAERLRQRGTAAHNTLTIDGEDSSEVWGGFRVARRARVGDVLLDSNIDTSKIQASHDGYLRLRGVGLHTRKWEMTRKSLKICDEMEGTGSHKIELGFLVHPEISVTQAGAHHFELKDDNGKVIATIYTDVAMAAALQERTYHPEFGLWLKTTGISAKSEVELPASFNSEIIWE